MSKTTGGQWSLRIELVLRSTVGTLFSVSERAVAELGRFWSPRQAADGVDQERSSTTRDTSKDHCREGSGRCPVLCVRKVRLLFPQTRAEA